MKFTLNEDIEEEVTETSTEKFPDKEVVNAALVSMLNDTINKEWEEVNNLNANIATIKYENPSLTEIISILDNIITEKNIHIGMLTKALSLIDPETQALMDAGIEKAEAVIAEPATNDLHGN